MGTTPLDQTILVCISHSATDKACFRSSLHSTPSDLGHWQYPVGFDSSSLLELSVYAPLATSNSFEVDRPVLVVVTHNILF